MKHLDLKPVADRCKKMLYKGCLFVGAVAACGLAACSDDYEGTVSMNFPQMQTIVCNADETKDFSFDASAEWSLSSSEIWCKLVQDGQESFVISGTGGTQHITIHVTDENSTAEEASTAKLELTMGNRTVAIAEVIRSAKGSELKIYDMDGNELEYLTVGYDEYEPFKVKANYHFAVTGTPDWVQVEGGSMVGTSNQEVEGALQIVQDGTVEKYPVTVEDGAKIVFSAEDGRAYAEFPLVFAGMDENEIDIDFPEGTTHFDNWAVSLDAKTFVQEASVGSSASSSPTFTNKLSYTLKALKDEYVYLYGSPVGENGMEFTTTSPDWIHLTGDAGKVSLTVDPGESERTIYVLAFSKAGLAALDGDYSGIWDDAIGDFVNIENVLIHLTQKNIVESDVSGQLFGEVLDALTQTKLDGLLLNSGSRLEEYQSKYGVSSVLEVTVPATTQSIFVTLNFTLDTSLPFELYNAEGESAPEKIVCDPDFSQGDDNPRLNIYGLADLAEDVLVIATEASEPDGEGRKVMVVVHPASQSGEEEIDRLVVTDMSTTPLTCSVYSGGDAADLKAAYGCEEIWQIDNPASDMCVSLASGTDIDTNGIKMYQYVWGETAFTEILNSNGEWNYDNWNGLMIWSGTGSWGTSNLYQKDVLIVIPDVNGKKYGLMYVYYGDF